ncbi:adenylate/guanylate cyclase catalytic domain protein [Dictyocaulus viviparus]|uniref:Adenylate/guanylate cyclase catalytic domain protein n=1 Tax=Dictyocaulus viviparus TaxID=29172 RepID=A0A0D8XNX6_DICVI|nr:adenylate/guanylate cyclase catalytic domain protein [Dictyocaulus viviparus]
MWSFGTILFEILFRRKYIELDDHYDCEDDVLICEKADDVLRNNPPKVPDDREIHADLRQLIQKCWDRADNRPDVSRARKITDATLKMSGSLVDQMIKNMEEYTNGLEELVKRRTGLLEQAQQKADELLSELLPKSVAEELKVGRRVEAKNYKSATILYSDIVGFTSLCSESEPMEVVALLSGLFQKFDHIISVHNGYKMETIGDAYCVASGVPNPSKTEHVSNIATIALLQREQAGFRKAFRTVDHIQTIIKLIEVTQESKELHCSTFIDFKKAFNCVEIKAVMEMLINLTSPIKYIEILRHARISLTKSPRYMNKSSSRKAEKFLYEFMIPHRPGQYLHCRWGFNTGPVFTGVVGIRAPRYSVFGPTGIGTLLTYWLEGVEELLRSDRTKEQDAPVTTSTSEDDIDPLLNESSQISSAKSVEPLIP